MCQIELWNRVAKRWDRLPEKYATAKQASRVLGERYLSGARVVYVREAVAKAPVKVAV